MIKSILVAFSCYTQHKIVNEYEHDCQRIRTWHWRHAAELAGAFTVQGHEVNVAFTFASGLSIEAV